MPETGYERARREQRERDNASREKKGAAADAAAESQINKGDLAAAARAKAAAPKTAEDTQRPARDKYPAGLAGEAAYQKAVREYDKKRTMSTMTVGSQQKALKP